MFSSREKQAAANADEEKPMKSETVRLREHIVHLKLGTRKTPISVKSVVFLVLDWVQLELAFCY